LKTTSPYYVARMTKTYFWEFIKREEMKRIVLIICLLTEIMVIANAQEISKAPKRISVEAGYRYLPSTTFDIKNQGVTILVDYAWQLSGFDGKKAPVFISVPLGYTYFFGGGGTQMGGILSYGWTVKHELKKSGKAIPFLGYGLLLNNLRINGTEGSVFGHQTCFDFGYLFKTGGKADVYTKLEYSYTRYPRLGEKKSNSMQGVELKVGVRF
jgi:hypothetical protein